jgi:hypothetical protein
MVRLFRLHWLVGLLVLLFGKDLAGGINKTLLFADGVPFSMERMSLNSKGLVYNLRIIPVGRLVCYVSRLLLVAFIYDLF